MSELSPEAERQIGRLVREGTERGVRSGLSLRQPGTVAVEAPVGGVAHVVLDVDSAEPIPPPTFAIVETVSVHLGDRVMVDLPASGGAWVTGIITKLADLPRRDISTDQSPISTGAVVDVPNLSVTFTQTTPGLPVLARIRTHYLSSALGDQMLVTVRDGAGVGISQARIDVVVAVVNFAIGLAYWFVERPDAGVHTRVLSMQRIGTSTGNCRLFGDADRPHVMRYENAEGEFQG